jgi:hypothetical protein
MKQLAVVALALGLLACGKKDKETKSEPAATGGETATKPSEPAPPPPPPKKAGRDIPNSRGLVVEAPAKWLDNGIGGAAGMHLDADGGDFSVREVSAEEAGEAMEAHKKGTEEFLFEKWISSKKTADGWELVYVLDKIEMKGDEAKKVGTTFAFDVRRKIGAALYSCSGAASTKEIAEEAIALCQKVSGS